MSIKNLSTDLTNDQIKEFLYDNGLPKNHKDEDILIGNHGNVDINNLDKDVCIAIVMSLDKKVFFNKILHCRPIIGLSQDLSISSIQDTEANNSTIEDTEANNSTIEIQRLTIALLNKCL